MKYFIYALMSVLIASCSGSRAKKIGPVSKHEAPHAKNDTIRIANDDLEYEVIIIDSGFNGWLLRYARPRNYYSQQYLEARNRSWVIGWNSRAAQGHRLFDMQIDYSGSIDYGYEVNYLLYNYLVYFQLTNNISLGGFPARI